VKNSRKIKKPKITNFKFRGKVIVWSSGYDREDYESAWRFVPVPDKISAKIFEMQKSKPRRGWGAIYAKVKIGKTEWVTSIFKDWHRPIYILPLKKQVRRIEDIYDGKKISVQMGIWF
jgi:hypothetical protein